MGVGVQRGVFTVLDDDRRHVLLRHAVFVRVADRRHREHRDGAERQRAFVGRVPDLVEHSLAVAAFANLVSPGGEADVAGAGGDVIIGGGDARDAGRAAGIDPQERLAARPDRVDAEPLGVADADHGVGRKRIDDGLDVLELEFGVGERQRDRLTN